jgi:dTMP kinase
MAITSIEGKYPGLFLAVEGIDGSGKTETVKIMAAEIRKQFPNHELVTFRAPGATPAGEDMRNILLNRVMHPMSELLMFMASHNETIHQVIIPALQRGAIVLTDRFIDSTYAYQGAGRQLHYAVELIHKGLLHGIEPDHVIFVRTDQNVANSRMTSRGNMNHLDELASEIKTRIRDGMEDRRSLRQSIASHRTSVIENNGTIDDLTAYCREFVKNNIVPQESYFSVRSKYETDIEFFSNKLKEARSSRDRLDNALIPPDPSVFAHCDNEIILASDGLTCIKQMYEQFLSTNTQEDFNKKLVQDK